MSRAKNITLIRIAVLALGLLNTACAEVLEDKQFSIDGFLIGTTTLDEIQSKYGVASISFADKSEESARYLCYASSDSKHSVYFETGALGGFTRLTGFRLGVPAKNMNCTKTKLDLTHISTGNGVSIGLTENDFVKKFSIDFKKTDSTLVYEADSKRKATAEESVKLHQLYPSEPEFYFDVLTTIRAKFDKNGLSSYYVSNVESF